MSPLVVVLTAQTYRDLLPPEEPRPELGPGALVVARDLRIQPVGAERVELRAAWTLRADHPSGVALHLAGPEVVVDSVRLDGVEAPVVRDDTGTTLSTVIRGDARIDLVGYAAGDVGQRVHLDLLAAPTGTIEHPGGTVVDGATRIGPDRSAGGGGDLWIEPAPVGSTGTGLVVLGEAGLGLTVGEAEVTVSGRVRWRIERGQVDEIGFTVPGAGPDLAVTGAQIASTRRDGDHVTVVLRSPEKALVSLGFTYSVPTPPGEAATLPVPAVALDDVFRATATLELARDPTLDVVPTLPGWQAAAASDLPGWGQSLVEGVPAAAFVGQGGGGSLSILRFTPADSPATLVDVASYTIATNHDGLVLVQAKYTVRNDRGSVLRFTPPEGFEPIGVRVGTQPAKLSIDGRTWRIPLEKSVETVQGLLSFPVEVDLLGRVDPWDGRERRELPLPTVDAEVAVGHVTLYLPPGFSGHGRGGGRVDAFTEGQGITYGFAAGDERAAQADAVFQAAVDAWLENDFDRAKDALGQLDEIGASNEDITKLKSNLELVDGEKSGADAGLVERRVLEQARVRALEDEKEQKVASEKADQAYAAGDYAAAEQQYKKAVDLGKNLAKLHTEEDKSQEAVNERVQSKLDSSVAVSSQKAASSMSQLNNAPAKPSGALRLGEPARQTVDTTSTTTGVDFEGVEIEGELLAPTPDVAEAPSTPAAVDDLQDEVNGVEGGVEGGVVGGVLGGVVAGTTSSENTYYTGDVDGEPAPAEPIAEPEEITVAGRTFESVLQSVPGVSGHRGAPPKAPKAEPPPPADMIVEDAPAYRVDGANVEVGKTEEKAAELEPEAPVSGKQREKVAGPRLGVTASSLSVVVPENGERVLYQHLLLPSGSTWVVPIDARESRRNR